MMFIDLLLNSTASHCLDIFPDRTLHTPLLLTRGVLYVLDADSFKLWSQNGSFEVRHFVAAAVVVVTNGEAMLQAAGASLWLGARSWPFDSKNLKSFFDVANSDIVTAEHVGVARIGACSL